MQVINWLELQPLPADLDALNERLQEALPLRKVCQLLVETIVHAYPWTGRADLISCYHPSQTYKQGQSIALLIPDSQKVHRTVWLFAQVKQARIAENPIQGRFQVLTLTIGGRQIQMVGGIADASYPALDLSNYTAEDLAWLVKWVLETYSASLQATVKKLIEQGRIRGQLAGQTFVPEHVSAVSAELLHPIFARISYARPWISLEEILRGLPELSPLKRETVLALLRASLQESPYRSLGGDRWTTLELFHQLNREVPRGLPTAHVRSKVSIWTKRDEQDLAGYSTDFMPREARGALEELEVAEKLPEPDDSPWRPPNGPVRLPALNYLHITQAYFPVGSILRAFAPGVDLILVQFIDGDHQPFLLDGENGLLKAVHPERLATKILKDGVPAGTYLWLEHQESDKYRITPRPLPFKRMAQCKLAYIEKCQLHIEHTQVSMIYEGNPSLFKANLRLEDIEALFAEASHVNLSVRDAIVYAMQEICATDPDHRAHWWDVFNAVFLKRLCSPGSVAFLLHTQSCFEPLGGGYFCYKPTSVVSVKRIRKRTDRLSQLWHHLLSNPVAPHPLTKVRTTVAGGVKAISPTFFPDLELPPLLSQPEDSVASLSYTPLEENQTGKIALKAEEPIEMLVVSDYEAKAFLTPTDAVEPVSHPWIDSLERLYRSVIELQKAADSPLVVEKADRESEAFSSPPVENAHEEATSFSTPFRWEPKSTGLNVPIQPGRPSPKTVDTQRLVYRSKIPLRPLHKQRFYRRFFFYLRRWLNIRLGKAI